MDATKASTHFTELWEPYNALVKSMDRLMEIDEVTNREVLDAQTNTALEQAHNYQQIKLRKPIRNYLGHSRADDGSPLNVLGVDTPTPKKFIKLMHTKAIDLTWLTENETPTTMLGLIHFMHSLEENEVDVAENIGKIITSLAKVSLRNLDKESTFQMAFVLAVLETSWRHAVRLDTELHVTWLLGFNETTDDAVITNVLGGGVPGGGSDVGGNPIQVWIDWATAAFDENSNLGTLMASKEFKRLHSLVGLTNDTNALLLEKTLTDTLQTAFETAKENIFAVLDDVVAALQFEQDTVAAESLVGKNMVQALNFLNAMGLAIETTGGIQGFVKADHMLHVETSLAGLRSIFEGLQATKEQQQKKIDKAIHRGLKPMVKPNKDRVRPGWILRPEFTHRVHLSAPTVAAINNAFAKVQQYLPMLAGGAYTELVHRGLKRTKIINQLYANLVASYLLTASIQFPRQWQADKAYPRSQSYQLQTIMAMSSWVWRGSAPYNTGKMRAAAGGSGYVPGVLGSPISPPTPATLLAMGGVPPPAMLTTALLPIGRPLKRQRTLTSMSMVMPIDSMAHFAMGWSPKVIRSAIVKALTETAHSKNY